jgi:hypothetical protein
MTDRNVKLDARLYAYLQEHSLRELPGRRSFARRPPE